MQHVYTYMCRSLKSSDILPRERQTLMITQDNNIIIRTVVHNMIDSVPIAQLLSTLHKYNNYHWSAETVFTRNLLERTHTEE